MEKNSQSRISKKTSTKMGGLDENKNNERWKDEK